MSNNTHSLARSRLTILDTIVRILSAADATATFFVKFIDLTIIPFFTKFTEQALELLTIETSIQDSSESIIWFVEKEVDIIGTCLNETVSAVAIGTAIIPISPTQILQNTVSVSNAYLPSCIARTNTEIIFDYYFPHLLTDEQTEAHIKIALQGLAFGKIFSELSDTSFLKAALISIGYGEAFTNQTTTNQGIILAESIPEALIDNNPEGGLTSGLVFALINIFDPVGNSLNWLEENLFYINTPLATDQHAIGESHYLNQDIIP